MRAQVKAFVALAVTLAVLFAGSTASFRAAVAQSTAPSLGTAASFSVLGAATVTNTGATVIIGDMGVGPGTAITGFRVSENIIVGPGTVTDGPGHVVSGTIYAGGIVAAQARADAAIAYVASAGHIAHGPDVLGKTCDFNYPVGDVQLVGSPAPGVHCISSSAGLPGTLTLNGNGNPKAVWIFQIGSTLTTASSSRVVLSNGARNTNVFWAVGSSATLGTGTRFAGNILALASITLTTGADLFGRALALNGAVTMDTNRISALCPGPPCSADSPSAVVAPNLGAAAGFSVLGAATVTNTGATIVGGDLGVSPGSAITGFNSSNAIVGPGTVTDGPGLVTGTIHAGDTAAAQAQAAAAIAYGDLAGRACNVTYGEVAELGGLNLAPGVHCFPSSAFVTGTLTLNGSANSIWVFKIASTLVTAVNSSVVMGNEAAQDANVFWAVGSSATLGTGTRFRGNIIAHTSITLTTGANVSGRALALNGAVTMDTNNISAMCAGGRCLPAPSSRPAVSQVIVDNYQCDEAKLDKGSPRPRRNVVVTDELGTREVMLDRPLLVCSPATVQSGATAALAVRNTIDRLVCYDFIERGSLDSERREVSVANAVFEPRRLRVKKPKLVCLSSLQTLLDDSDD